MAQGGRVGSGGQGRQGWAGGGLRLIGHCLDRSLSGLHFKRNRRPRRWIHLYVAIIYVRNNVFGFELAMNKPQETLLDFSKVFLRFSMVFLRFSPVFLSVP